MGFRVYDYDDAGHELEIKDDGIYVKIRGAESWQEGEYTNEANRTIEVKLPDDEVERVVRELAPEYDECMEDHLFWRDLGVSCPVCGVNLSD